LEGVFASAREIAEGFIGNVGHVDRREVAGAGEAGQGHGVPLVGLDPIAGLARDQRGGHDEAREALPGEVAVQPIAAGAGLIDEHELGALALELPHEGIDVALPGPDGAEGDGVSGAIPAGVGDGDGIFVDIEADVKCASLPHS
jgi:hypothetical protein